MRKTKLFFGLLIGALVLGFTACQQGTQDVNVVDGYDKNQSGFFEGTYYYDDTLTNYSTTNYPNTTYNNTNNNTDTSTNTSTTPSKKTMISGEYSYVIGNGTTKNSNFYTLTLKIGYSSNTYTIKKYGKDYYYNGTQIEVSGNIFSGNFTIKELGIYKNLEFKAL